jgi:Phage integrase, N-terminal SAM-like domain
MARRARGAGAVFQRADGRWEAQLRIGPSRRRSLYAQTRRDVVVKLDQARWSMALGLPVRMPVTRTVADFLNDWLEVTRSRVRCSTFENYDFNVRRINSQLGAIPLCRLTPPTIQEAYSRLRLEGVGDAGIQPAPAALHRTVLTRLATLTLRRGELARGRLRAVALGVCVAANVAVFLAPANSLAGQVRARDQHVAAVTAAVRWFDPSTTVLLTDPEGPSSYRTAMYYLPEYDVVAVGRDWHGRAGEMFSNRVGAPEYDLARFGHAGPLVMPAGGLAVILDDAVLRSLGDPQWLETSTYGPGAADRMYLAHLAPADPPLNNGDLIYLRGSDCPCRGALRGRPLTRRGAPA